MSEKKTELNLVSRIESVEQAAVEAAKFAERHDFGDDVKSAIDMAVREAVANAVKHGNKLDETKQVEVTFENSSEGFEITV